MRRISKGSVRVAPLIACCVFAAAARAVAGTADPKALAAEIIKTTGVRAGLCVELGCGDGRLTSELARAGKFLVHGLARDSATVERARRHILSRDLYGKASVERSSFKRLPYAANLVNLVVAEDLPALGLPLGELVRVLVPNGVVCLRGRTDRAGLSAAGFKDIRTSGAWTVAVKPRPEGMDEWTHPRHGPDGNPVSRDTLGAPTGFRWLAGPVWPKGPRKRSLQTFVSANGRNICLTCNEYTNLTVPKEKLRWQLVARDAYNGFVLWSRPWDGIMPPQITNWGYATALPESKRSWHKPMRPGEGGRVPYPMVLVGDRFYTAANKRVVVIDAATGQIVRRSEELESIPETMALQDDHLLVVTRKQVYSLDPDSCGVKWRFPTEAIDPVLGGNRVFFLDSAEEPYDLVSLELEKGTELWRKNVEQFYLPPRSAKAKGVFGSFKKKKLRLQPLALRVYRDGKLFLSDWETIYAVSAEDGSHLWTYDKISAISKLLFQSVFCAADAVFPMNARTGLDPATGEIKLRTGGTYARCQTNRMTEKYHIGARAIVFTDLKKKASTRFYGARGACREGVVPANNLLYLFPQGCFCGGLETATRGFIALAADKPREAEAGNRLEKGPAFGKQFRKPGAGGRDDWPTFKHDPARSGYTPTAVPAELKLVWEKELTRRAGGPLEEDWNASPSFGDPLTGPVVANEKIFIALPETHQVVALDENSGRVVWSYTAGGRIDSPPTTHEGLCLFGSHDGWVYCLRASGGELIWRFRAAPEEKRIAVFGQLESPWPVPGSVLVVDDLAYFAAGRNSGADGGMRVFALEPETGKVVWEEKIVAGRGGHQAMSDVMVSDSKFVYLTATPGLLKFDLKTGKKEYVARSRYLGRGKGSVKLGEPDPQFLIGTQLGILDGAWRRIGSSLRPRKGGERKSTYGSMNALMFVFNRSRVCGYHVSSGKWKKLDVHRSNFMGRRLVEGKFVKDDKGWQLKVPRPGQFEAILLSGDTLFAAGPVDGITPKEGTLWAISAADGRLLKKHPLPASPVYHGIAAAGGRLYIATQNGKLLCFGRE